MAIALGLCALVAGCGRSAASRTTPIHTGSQATPVPTSLVSYSSAAKSTLDGTVSLGKQVLSQMQSDGYDTLTTDCSNAGPTIDDQASAFRSVFVPSGAGPVVQTANRGFKLMLGGIDECGMAADQWSGSQRGVATSDFASGLALVEKADGELANWQAKHS